MSVVKIICHSFLGVHNSVGEGEQEGTTNLTFFLKIKNTDPLMCAKFESKKHLLKGTVS